MDLLIVGDPRPDDLPSPEMLAIIVHAVAELVAKRWPKGSVIHVTQGPMYATADGRGDYTWLVIECVDEAHATEVAERMFPTTGERGIFGKLPVQAHRGVALSVTDYLDVVQSLGDRLPALTDSWLRVLRNGAVQRFAGLVELGVETPYSHRVVELDEEEQ